MFVLTIDQRGSTHGSDRVPALLVALDDLVGARPGIVLPFERTVGDEVQALLDDPETVLDVILLAARDGGWSTGLGIGEVRTPLPASTREAAGDAFVRARTAVDRAKSRTTPVPLAVEGPDPARASEIESLLQLVFSVVGRRSSAGYEAVEALARHGGSQKAVADELGVSDQAVSQRLRAALWPEEQGVRPLVTRLLKDADA